MALELFKVIIFLMAIFEGPKKLEIRKGHFEIP